MTHNYVLSARTLAESGQVHDCKLSAEQVDKYIIVHYQVNKPTRENQYLSSTLFSECMYKEVFLYTVVTFYFKTHNFAQVLFSFV